MSTVREDLESFHQFAAERLAHEATVATLDDLFMQWHDSRSTDAINEAIRQGLADIEAGQFAPAQQAMDSIRKEFGFRPE